MQAHLAYRNLIKRNKKAEDKREAIYCRYPNRSSKNMGASEDPTEFGETENIKIRMPFVLANVPDRPDNYLSMIEYNKRRLELIS